MLVKTNSFIAVTTGFLYRYSMNKCNLSTASFIILRSNFIVLTAIIMSDRDY